MKIGKMFIGIVFLLLGFTLLGQTMGIYSISPFISFFSLWPIALIFVGVCLIIRQRGLAFMFLGLFGFMLFMSIVSTFLYVNASNPFSLIEKSDMSITNTELVVNFGVGTVNIHKGTDLVSVNGNSTIDEPNLNVKKIKSKANVEISREDDGFPRGGFKEHWDIGLETLSRLNFDYGVADAHIDLTGLEVEEMNLNFGISKTEIIFSEFPTIAEIDAGLSDITFVFPKGYGIMIETDVGLCELDFQDMEKHGNTYYLNYNENGDNIEIILKSGVSKIRGVWK